MLSKLLYCLLISRLRTCLRTKKKNALDNGSKLLEDLIASCDGKSNPIRHYSADELVRATNNFHPSCLIQECRPRTFRAIRLYKGFLDNRLIMIKWVNISYYDYYYEKDRDEAIRDIIISTQMSAHKNVLKLLGCCLEFPVPALVHEYAAKGVLNSEGGYGDNDESLPWETRLCIAKQLANAITYLHTAFPRPIIHRHINPTGIFLDHDFAPKLFDFARSISIPPEQSHVEDFVTGTFGYVDPEYSLHSRITEKTDVYSFGVTLLVFFTGRRRFCVAHEDYDLLSYVSLHASDDQFLTIVDPKILEELKGEDEQAQQQQLHDFLALALLCTREESERRPDMIDVAKELVRIDKSINPC